MILTNCFNYLSEVFFSNAEGYTFIYFIFLAEPTGSKAPSTHIAVPGRRLQYAPFNGLTTFMADYVKHPYAPPQPICKPPSSNNHYDLGPFDGRTTQSIAYKAWPVIPFEKPTWAIKPQYQRPRGGMPFDSTYMVNT